VDASVATPGGQCKWKQIVGIQLQYLLVGRGEFFFIPNLGRNWGLPSVRLGGFWVILGQIGQGVKVTNYLPPSSAEVKNAWSYSFASPYIFNACTVTTLRLTFTPSCLVPRASHYTLQQAELTYFDQTRVRTELFYPLVGVIDTYQN
jgi:membrane-associated protease RseP (regulator of RpoE activity)